MPVMPGRISDDRSFGASLGWTVLGAIIPGLGLVRGGRRIIGSILIALWVIVVGGVAGLWVTNRSLLTGLWRPMATCFTRWPSPCW